MFEQYYNNKIRVFVLLTFTIDGSFFGRLFVRSFFARLSLYSSHKRLPTHRIHTQSHSNFIFTCVCVCVCAGLFSSSFRSFIRSASFFRSIRSSLPSLNSHKLLYFIWLSDDMTIDWRRKFCSKLYAHSFGRAWIFTLGFSRPINVFIWNALILKLWCGSFLFLLLFFSLLSFFLSPRSLVTFCDNTKIW